MFFKNKWTGLFVLSFSLLSIPNAGQDSDSPEITLGGALRFNYNYSDWIKESRKQGGEFGYDVFRINANGKWKNISFNAEYRFYANSSGGGMLKHGWIAYHFDPKNQLQFGQNVVPFGVLPYNSHNWFFSINYYLGLEDDSDMGIKFIHEDEKWQVDAAFYKNSDIIDFHSSDGISTSRYGYDIGGKNKEINQGNLRVVRRFGEIVQNEIGVSGEIGGLYNTETERTGSRSAFAAHYELNYKNWNLKAQYANFNISPKDPIEIQDEDGDWIPNPAVEEGYVEMAAYGALYNMARKGETYTLGVSYHLPVNKGILDAVTFYNDFGWFHKRIKGMKDSYQNVAGAMLSMGPIYTYIDFAMGKNHPWLGPGWTDSLAKGDSDKWNTRFNINVGYYF